MKYDIYVLCSTCADPETNQDVLEEYKKEISHDHTHRDTPSRSGTESSSAPSTVIAGGLSPHQPLPLELPPPTDSEGEITPVASQDQYQQAPPLVLHSGVGAVDQSANANANENYLSKYQQFAAGITAVAMEKPPPPASSDSGIKFGDFDLSGSGAEDLNASNVSKIEDDEEDEVEEDRMQDINQNQLNAAPQISATNFDSGENF